jgi:tetratricopeptide (TPR) repeat protein
VILAVVLPGTALWGQKQIKCPNSGEVRIEIDVAKLALTYQAQSFETTLSGLRGLVGGKTVVSPKTLQEASAATQQWNELLKGLAAGWNSCAISQQQYDEGLKRIYPRLKDDALELEQIRAALAKGQQADARHLQDVLERYFENLRRFAKASNSKIVEAIRAVVEQSTDKILVAERNNSLKLDNITQKMEEMQRQLASLPKPAEVGKEISALKKQLLEKADEAEKAYNQGYALVQQYQFREAVPHLRTAIEAVPLASFYRTLGEALRQLPDLVEAERVVREGLRHVDGKAEQEASLNNQLGLILMRQGNLPGALKYILRAIQNYEKVYGSDDPRVAATAGNIGVILKDQGDLAGALEYSRRALKIHEEVYGPEHPKVAIDANNIGTILYERGDLAGALEYSRRALKIEEKAYGPDHPTVAIDANNIGLILQDRGDLWGALAYSRRALEIDEKVYGPEHPEVAVDTNNIGTILKDQGDLSGALEYIKRALKIDRRFTARITLPWPGMPITSGKLSKPRGTSPARLSIFSARLRLSRRFMALTIPTPRSLLIIFASCSS